MWTEERDGKVRFIETYTCPLTGKKKRVMVTMPSASPYYRKRAQVALQAKIEERTRPLSDKTVDECVESFLAYKRTHLKRGSYEVYRMSLQRFFDTIPRDALFRNLDVHVVEKALVSLIHRYGASTIKQSYTIFKHLYRYAYRQGVVENLSLLDRVSFPKLRNDRQKSTEYLEPEELRTVLQYVYLKNPHMARILELQALTGLRYGEAIALQYEDYDGKCLHVRATYSLYGERTSPKTSAAYRSIALCQRGRAIVEGAIEEQKRLERGNEHTRQGYILADKRGVPIAIRHTNMTLARAPIDKRVRTHVFRHTHITALVQANVPVRAIMSRVGHSSPSMTLAVYAHHTQQMEEATVQAIEGLGWYNTPDNTPESKE